MIAGISYPPIPVLEIGPLSLSLHGLFAGVGFVIGAMVLTREVRRRGFDVDKTWSVITWGLIGALLGARLLTIPAHLGTEGYGWDDIISLSGAYSILGGYAGGLVAGGLRMRMVGLPVIPLMDMVAPGLAIGAVIGRIGDLAIVEHLGAETSFFLGYTVKPGYDLAAQHDALECVDATAIDGICGTYHHTAMYDMIGAAVLLVALLLLRRRWSGIRYGQLIAVWMAWYGLQRFLIDFTRLTPAESGDQSVIADGVIGPLTGSQWGALGLALLGVVLFLYWRRNPVVTADQDALYRRESIDQPETAGDPDASVDPSAAEIVTEEPTNASVPPDEE